MKEILIVVFIFAIAAIIYSSNYDNSYIPERQPSADEYYAQANELLNKESDAYNEKAGVEALTLAAEKNHADAMYDLGNIFLEGQAVTADPEQAESWFFKASDLFLHPKATHAYGMLMIEKLPGKALAYLEAAEALGVPADPEIMRELRINVDDFAMIYEMEKALLSGALEKALAKKEAGQ